VPKGSTLSACGMVLLDQFAAPLVLILLLPAASALHRPPGARPAQLRVAGAYASWDGAAQWSWHQPASRVALLPNVIFPKP